MTTEVIAEVADVVIKKEEVVLRLPSPFQRINGVPVCTMGCLAYLQSLLHTKDYVVDALPILKVFPTTQTVPLAKAQTISGQGKKEMLDRFRFSIRFNFQGGRGFDIIRRVLDATVACLGFQKPNKKCSKIQRERRSHLNRVLAPMKARLSGIIRADDRQKQLLRDSSSNLDFENPVNSQQQRAVVDIVYNFHGNAPYIIEGPAGTGMDGCKFYDSSLIANRVLTLCLSFFRQDDVCLRGHHPSVPNFWRQSQNSSLCSVGCCMRCACQPSSSSSTTKVIATD